MLLDWSVVVVFGELWVKDFGDVSEWGEKIGRKKKLEEQGRGGGREVERLIFGIILGNYWVVWVLVDF